ncbi:hypothetical protein BgAZ_303200 [Babesia gibsoni]|uniref:Uncharacterized protein n=1 Tax=Babesia gibsoni TaxID=33632 RepID=A0AAD8PDX3_BABGI|nr:hypothetical protein BgAZ_303200 [Babesia gibsoni]
MVEFIDRAVNNSDTIARLRLTFDNKIESIKEELRQGLETPSYIFLGRLNNEMLKAIAASDVITAQKWLFAITFVIDVERMRHLHGIKIQEDASQFLEGVVSKLVAVLETASPLLLTDIWRVIKESFEFMLIPQVSTVVKCHRRLANHTFKSILHLPSTEDSESVILVLITWMCSTRTFDSEKADDALYLNQLHSLLNSKNNRISKEAASLLLLNLRKVSKREEKSVPLFISSTVKHISKELELGSTNKLSRMLFLLKETFDNVGKGSKGAVLDLAPLWRMLILLFERMGECEIETSSSGMSLLESVVSFLGPDLVLVNVTNVARIVDVILKNKVETVVANANGIVSLLKRINELCQDFYLLMADQLRVVIEVASSNVSKGNYKDIPKLVGLVTQMCGNAVGPTVEAFIVSLISNNRIPWTDLELSESVVRLIRVNLGKGCSNHPKVLNMFLSFIRWLRGKRSHNSCMDDTIHDIQCIICDVRPSEPNVDYTLYAQELQKLNESRAKEPKVNETEEASAPKVESSPVPTKNKQEDVVDAIRKKLKAMRKAEVS